MGHGKSFFPSWSSLSSRDLGSSGRVTQVLEHTPVAGTGLPAPCALPHLLPTSGVAPREKAQNHSHFTDEQPENQGLAQQGGRDLNFA